MFDFEVAVNDHGPVFCVALALFRFWFHRNRGTHTVSADKVVAVPQATEQVISQGLTPLNHNEKLSKPNEDFAAFLKTLFKRIENFRKPLSANYSESRR